MTRSTAKARNTRFLIQPNRTILYLSLPILLSLIAEPVTGLVDTGFVAQLGSTPLASLTVGTGALTSLFWVFGFLGIATQTEVAQALGKRDLDGAVKSVSLILTLGAFVSLALSALLIPAAEVASSLLGAEGEVLELASEYIRLRLMGAPAVVITIVGFGALRGVQDMKTPLWIALGDQFHQYPAGLCAHIWLGFPAGAGRWRCGIGKFPQSMAGRLLDAVGDPAQNRPHAGF